MIMIKKDNMVVALDKTGSWPGITFPGGHVEKGESFKESAIREAKEETGLDVKDVYLKGIINWDNKETGERYIELLYVANGFEGVLKDGSDEGRVFWIDSEELKHSNKLSQNFDIYLNMFFNENYGEVHLDWDGNNWDGNPEYM